MPAPSHGFFDALILTRRVSILCGFCKPGVLERIPRCLCELLSTAIKDRHNIVGRLQSYKTDTDANRQRD